MPVVTNGLLADVRPALLELGQTVCHAGHFVRHTDLTLPLILGHLLQRRLDALQVIDGRAGLAAQQVAEPVANPAVVIVLDDALGHELLAGQVGGEELVHQELQDLDFALQRAKRIVFTLQVRENVVVLGVAFAVRTHHFWPGHAVDEVERGVDAVLEVRRTKSGVGGILLP